MCPSGYVFQRGDSNGGAHRIESKIVKDIEECGDRCNNNEKCRSLEWNPSGKWCNLMSTEITDNGDYKDYLFCTKKNGWLLNHQILVRFIIN